MKKLLMIFYVVLSFSVLANDYLAKGVIASDGKIIEGENVDIKHPLASITKLMSAVVTLEAVEAGEVSLNDTVVVDRESAGIGGSYIGLRSGEKISLQDLLYASMIHSANNATYVMAKYVAGSYEEFVARMNQKAEELGMLNTEFYTPAGLPSIMTGEGMDVGTIEDVAKLSLYALENEKLMEIVGKSKVLIKKGAMTLNNRNKNLKVEGVDGLKTGHHDNAGYNITVSTERDGIRYIFVVFGSPSENMRDKEIQKSIEYIYSEYREEYLVNKDDFVLEVPIIGGKKSLISLYAEEDILELVKSDWKLSKSVYIPKELKAPVEAGETVGVYVIMNEGVEIARVNLVAKETMPKGNWIDEMLKKINE